MSREENNGKDHMVPSKDPADAVLTLRMYYVRIHDKSERLGITMKFDNDIVCSFERVHQIQHANNFNPFIYTLDLNVRMKEEGMYLEYDKNQKKIDEYKLTMLCPGGLLGSSTLEEEGNVRHSLKGCFNTQHWFHFGIRFSPKFRCSPPGEDTNVFTDFCLFTCSILQSEMFSVFDTLLDQLKVASPTENNTLNAEEFKDFFEKCDRYVPDILATSTANITVLKVILRMIGALSIQKEAFDRDNDISIRFASVMMYYVWGTFENLYQHVRDDEWILFSRGLVMLISIELLQYKSNHTNENKVIFLQRIPDQAQRRTVANKLLSRLCKLEEILYGDPNWTDLFTLVDPRIIHIDHMRLTKSIETFIICITKIAQVLPDTSTFEDALERHLEDRIGDNSIEVDLNDIIFLLKFLEQQLSESSETTMGLLNTLLVTIRTNGMLKNRVADSINRSVMTIQNMEQIELIIHSSSKCGILQRFKQETYLEKTLVNTPSSAFLIKWPQYFLAKTQVTNQIEKIEWKRLLKKYIDCLKTNQQSFFDVLKDMDQILHAFDDSVDHGSFGLEFTNRIIDLCFEQNILRNTGSNSFRYPYLDSILWVIADGLFHVQNVQFRLQFGKIFAEKCLCNVQQDEFKDMISSNNPLVALINLDSQNHIKSILVRDLMKISCEKIDMTKKELLRDTFYAPSMFTLIYMSLFHESLTTLPIHTKMIDQLSQIWKEWAKDGFLVSDINKWQMLDNNRKEIAIQIWNLVVKHLEETIGFQDLMDTKGAKKGEIKKTIENVTSCIKIFCQDASDQDDYLVLLEELQRQLDQSTRNSARTSSEIEKLKPFADKIAKLSSSAVWQKYLEEKLKTQNNHGNLTEHKKSPSSCLAILEQVTSIIDEILSHLKSLHTNRKQPVLPVLTEYFPQRNVIAHQFNFLKPLLDEESTEYLKILLNYFQNRAFINDICRGCRVLFSKHNITTPDKKLSVLRDILDIDDRTSSKACITAYQDYCNHYSNSYSTITLEFIAQQTKSSELLEFLYDLRPTDIDVLVEIVNDWDETTTNTESVFSLILLKRNFEKLDKTIEVAGKRTSLDVDRLMQCYEDTLKNVEYKDITSTIELCHQNLSNIKRICTETSNERSNRQRVLDIMKNASFYFDIVQPGDIPDGRGEYQFDVNVISKQWQPISFYDLSDLRNRVRLTRYGSSNSNDSNNSTNNNHNMVFQSFVSLVDTVEIILQNLTSLYQAGYPIIQQYIKIPQAFTCPDENYHRLKEFNSSLQMELIDWEKQICATYRHCINLTYISHQQFTMIDDAVRQGTITNPTDPMYHLMKFIEIDPNTIDIDYLSQQSSEPFDLLQTVASIVQTTRHISLSSIEEDDTKNKKVLVIETTDNGVLRAIYSFWYLNNLSPVPNQLFYCTEKTSWMEIRAFIYRCFYSQKLHQLIRPERLSIAIQDQFIALLHQLIEQSPKHFFRLGIITTSSTTNLYLLNNFNMQHIVRMLNDQEMLNESNVAQRVRESIGSNCKLVTSSIAGLGKSTYIQNEASKLGKKYIKFPINGDINIRTLTAQLRDAKIQSASSPICIHIDIGPVQNVQQLNEFLYSLVLFRSFRLEQIPVNVQRDVPIFIELDSSSYLSTLKDQLVILQHLSTEHISQIDWNKLNINQPSVQLVVRYLQAIENETINTQNINEETTATVSKQQCVRLLRKHIDQMKNLEFISWTQCQIFISVYYNLLSNFSKCPYFYADPGITPSVRLDILTALLASSDQFTSLSVEKVRENQRAIDKSQIPKPFSDAIIRWDTSQPFTLIFTYDNEPLFVYKTKKSVPKSVTGAFKYYFETMYRTANTTKKKNRGFFSLFQSKHSSTDQATAAMREVEQQLDRFFIDPNTMKHEQFFLRLTLLSKKYSANKSICDKCYTQYSSNIKNCTQCSTNNILVTSNSNNYHDYLGKSQKEIAQRLQSEYVLTADNYVKMLLIYLRVQSNLPVLIMGETGKPNIDLMLRSITYSFVGCGKTALIQFLCQKILDDDMEVFHIHGDVTNEIIIEHMQHFIKKSQELIRQGSNKRLWVFLDEFNTTPSIGLLKEIVCERTLLGEALPDNMVFLGACNPQRHREAKKELDDDVAIKKYHLDLLRLTSGLTSSLLYSVVAIPESMLENVWDYGYLNEATEKSYIDAVVSGCDNLTTNGLLFRAVVNTISASQKFFRVSEDQSSVSLRDVTRFCRFYKWFYKYSDQYEGKDDSVLKSHSRSEYSSLLALFFCYYFRLISNDDRNKYMDLISFSMQHFKSSITSDVLKKLLYDEKMALVNRMELPPGTAKNRALTDNIFVLFTCIVNRIPVILSGKPGSSKTSSVQIVISNLKGEQSKDQYFQTLPGLTAISYQGSHNCTSESIIKTFAQADKVAAAQVKENVKLLPVIVFDEIGLAELSPHNPLKVLHSELEIEKCRHGFVGLSNWRLDASKMNRAIYLCCPDLSLDDLKTTATSIAGSIVSDKAQAIPLADSVIEGLAISYMDLCQRMKEEEQRQNYFGLRDYYSLIKGIVYDVCQKQNQDGDVYQIIRHQLAFNFNGVIDGSQFMWTKFCNQMKLTHKRTAYQLPTFDRLIDGCLTSRNGRFLMLIGDNENSFDYIQRYINIKYSSIQTRTLIGSTLADDLLSNNTYSQQYNIRILMDIIRFAEKDMTLFLRGLRHLYDNLYDLFNQSFAVSDKKKYCRIALGSTYHPRCFIHDGFYCVVFVKRGDLEKYDPPFLNRFEKHLIDLDCLINQHHETVINQLKQTVRDLISIKPAQSSLVPKHLFVEFNKDYIMNLVATVFGVEKSGNKTTENVHDECQQRMIRTSSFDLPLIMSINSSDATDHILQQYYDIHTDLSFSSFINQALQKNTISPLLIYTYTQISHSINYHGITNQQKVVEEIKLSHFKTELELIQRIKMHYHNDTFRLLFIRVDYHRDQQHLAMLKHFLLNEQTPENSRGICLIFHLQRNQLRQVTNDVLFTEWSTVMIDDLQQHQLIPREILHDPSYAKIIDHLQYLQTEEVFDQLIEQSIMKLRYRVTNANLTSKINEHRDQTMKQLTRHDIDNDLPSLRSLVKNRLLEMVVTPMSDPNQVEFKDWRRDLLTNEIVMGSCRSIKDALNKTISLFLAVNLCALLAQMERNSLIASHHFLLLSRDKLRAQLHQHWLDCWKKSTQTIDMSIITQNYIEIPVVFDLHLPYAKREYELIRQIRHIVSQHQDNDDDDKEKKKLDSAYKQLISTSVHGSSIDTILNDPNLFDYYYHDQLTLTRNEANIHQLSTSFVKSLLTSKILGADKDRLKHILVDYEELWQIMRLFEISISIVGDETTFEDIFEQQFLVYSEELEKSVRKNNKFYRFTMKEDSQSYLIHPGSSSIDDNPFECQGYPFIEVSLMNLIELLISSTHVNRVTNIKQLISTYSSVIQSVMSLTQYEINNLENMETLLRLASCLSALFDNDKALDMFKQMYRSYGCIIIFNAREYLYSFIKYFKELMEGIVATTNDHNFHDILLKFENELLKIWSINNIDQYNDILQCVYDYQLWKYATKTFTLIDRELQLSAVAREYDGQLAQNDQYEGVNQYLSQLNDSTHQIEVLVMFRIYIQLVFDQSYQPSIDPTSTDQLTEMLTSKLEWFLETLSEIKYAKDEQPLQRLSLLAWLRFYLLHYVYALKIDLKEDVMDRIHEILVENNSPFYSTVKLYIIKQLRHAEQISFTDLSKKYANRNITWIRLMTSQSSDRQRISARRSVILPMPLFECYAEFKRIDQQLNSSWDVQQWKTVINQCMTKQETAYCFILWFIHHYTRFYMSNVSTDQTLIDLIKNTINKELTYCFEPLGYQLIISLCTNFDEKCYFRLEHTMSEQELHHRLLVLNIIALLLSFKSARTNSLFSYLLLDTSLKMPKNYTEHFSRFESLTGVALANNPVLIRMIHIRHRMKQEDHAITDLFTCSSECLWLLYAVKNIVPEEQKQCPLCGKEISISQGKNRLIVNKPHKEMNIKEVRQFIVQRTEELKLNIDGNIGERPDYLKQSLTQHFIDFFVKSIFLFLHESKHMPHYSPLICSYFREYVATSYQSIRQCLSNTDQSHIWMYKMISHMMTNEFVIRGHIYSREKVVQLEKLIEDQLILPHIRSVISEIREYKSSYADFVYGEEKQHSIVNFVDELVQDEKTYPLLHFLNVTNIHSINLIDHCHTSLRLLTDHQQTHPLTTFLLPRLFAYDNIPHLYPIIFFTNRLMQQLNHQIKREDAKNKSIDFYLKTDQNLDTSYKQFRDAWSKIDRKELYLEDSQERDEFDNETNISTFLLNSSGDSESKVLISCLQTLATLQNEIVDHFRGCPGNDDQHSPLIPIQSIHQRHLFNFGTDKMRKFLVEKVLMINYEYGMSEEIIYNFDEIESTLRNEISSLPRIDAEHISYFDYQFELYDENVSLINQIRERFPQKLFDNDRKRTDIERSLKTLDNDSLVQLSGSLEYILSYLCTIINENIIKKNSSETLTIQRFIYNYLPSQFGISGLFHREPFSSVDVEHIIDLYEMVEEFVFDQIFYESILNESSKQLLNRNEIDALVKHFIEMIVNSTKLANCLKDLSCWISMFKRLLARLRPLKNKIDFDLPLVDYVKRSDMWKGNVTREHIQTIEMGANVRLKHAFDILQGLKARKDEIEKGDETQILTNDVSESRSSITTTTTSAIVRPPIPSVSTRAVKKKDLR